MTAHSNKRPAQAPQLHHTPNPQLPPPVHWPKRMGNHMCTRFRPQSLKSKSRPAPYPPKTCTPRSTSASKGIPTHLPAGRSLTRTGRSSDSNTRCSWTQSQSGTNSTCRIGKSNCLSLARACRRRRDLCMLIGRPCSDPPRDSGCFWCWRNELVS